MPFFWFIVRNKPLLLGRVFHGLRRQLGIAALITAPPLKRFFQELWRQVGLAAIVTVPLLLDSYNAWWALGFLHKRIQGKGSGETHGTGSNLRVL
jgi:hypothetical protein